MQQLVINNTPNAGIRNLESVERAIYHGEEPFDLITINLQNGSYIELSLDQARELAGSLIGLLDVAVPEPALV